MTNPESQPRRTATLIRAVAILVVALEPGWSNPLIAQAPLDKIDRFIEQGLREWNVPGLALAVVKNDSIVFARGYGVRESGKPDRVNVSTIFAIGSNTKSMTAAALAMLVDEGRISWDGRAAK